MFDGRRTIPALLPTVPRRWLRTLVFLGVYLALTVPPVVGQSTVVLRISVVNPLDREQRREVRSNLPLGLDVADIQDVGGLDLRYDVAQDRYYVYAMVDLGPRQRRDFRVTMRDIWFIPEPELVLLEEQAGNLAERLQDTGFAELAAGLAAEIRSGLLVVRENQNRNAIAAGARAADHIRTYHLNLEALTEIRNRVGELENLAMGAGRDPGRLLGTLPHAPRPHLSIEDADAGELVMLISLRNTSPDNSRTVDLRRDLPREVRVRDVLDAAGLEVGIDPARGGMVTVFSEGLELGPGETRNFEVRLRDRWNVHGPRMAALETAAETLLARVRDMRQFPSVEQFLEEVIVEIEDLRSQPAPTEINDRYVAFFRARGDRLDELADKIGRVEASLRPGQREQRLGFDLPAPDPKTTWLIIYGILAFLGTVSLLFFFRWYGKGQSVGSQPDTPPSDDRKE